MPRFIELKQNNWDTVIVNTDRIEIIQDEFRQHRTKIVLASGEHVYVMESPDTIISKSRYEYEASTLNN